MRRVAEYLNGVREVFFLAFSSRHKERAIATISAISKREQYKGRARIRVIEDSHTHDTDIVFIAAYQGREMK